MGDFYVDNYLIKGDRYYTKEHEWVLVKNGIAQVGITDYAQKQLGDIVYVDLPEVDKEVDAGDTLANLESVKNVAPVYAPITGTVVNVNEDLKDEPGLINDDPYDAGWIAIVEMKDPTEIEDLMTAEDYAEYLKEIVEEEKEEEIEMKKEEEVIDDVMERLEDLEGELGYEEEK
ncbi:MAG TPA: glycine cleavage system protein GcvH [Aquificaceae bacterium]|nr:glycine cleavage system protein GcvH [Aquificaceae bacterium]HIQ48337.1 glycine cleavage system protein GcvH [Aquifex aeolicus]